MNNLKYKSLLFCSLLFFSIAAFLEVNLSSFSTSDSHYKNFENTVRSKITRANQLLEDIIGEKNLSYGDYLDEYADFYEKEGIGLVVYENDSLLFWPKNSVPVKKDALLSDNYRLIKENNAYFLARLKENKKRTYKVLILVKYDYEYQNRFLESRFQKDFRLPGDFTISAKQEEGAANIYGENGNYLFSIAKGDLDDFKQRTIIVSALLYSAGLFFALILLMLLIINIADVGKRHRFAALFPFVLFLLRFAMVKFKFPYVFYQLELFSPFHYAFSYLLPSMGDLLFLSVFIFFSSLLLYRSIDHKNTRKFKTVAFLFSFVIILYSFFYREIFLSLVYNSSVLLNINEIYKLSVYSIVGILSVSLLSASFVFLLIKTFQLLLLVYKPARILIVAAVFYLATGLWFAIQGKPFILFSVLTFILISYLIIRKLRICEVFKYKHVFSLLVIISLFSVSFVVYHSLRKEEKVREVLVVNLANERNAVAEMLLEGFSERLANDSLVANYLNESFEYSTLLYDYLLKKYFNGFWSSYELQVIPCWESDSMFIENTAETVHCHTFFRESIKKYGVPISDPSLFYFLDNMNGRISYLGKIEYKMKEGKRKTLFISLDSKLVTETLGYPELLIDESKKPDSPLDHYSYAKYKGGKLETQNGEFAYSLVWSFKQKLEGAFTYFQQDGYRHLVYKINDKDVIVISRPKMRWLEIVVSFSYLFVAFYFFLVVLFLSIESFSEVFKLNFNFRIRFSMVIILILSFVLVGIGSTYFTIRQFEKKHHENITEKIQSVKIELEHKIGIEDQLDYEIVEYLESLLKKFSQVFFTDINVYGLEGKLLASSLPEIFNKELLNKQMNPKAFNEMVVKKKARFITKEKVGNMEYYSIYIPFYNYNDEPLAFLNLPYFTKQSELQKELIAMVFTIINIYIILIVITLMAAMFISNKVTRPLQLVQEKIRKINLNESNELIDYESSDEIGGLVKEYNKKVLELVDSAKKLAASERENAWREMARQIAHEIKNPLTPMKLSIQHLQRAFHHKVPDLDKKVDKVSLTLIEQINNLSTIANEFSNYAKMPEVKNEKVDIISKIKIVEELFINTENLSIHTQLPKFEELFVFADDKQITRVFINLVKNGIQSVSKQKVAEINISVEIKKSTAIIEVKDNGSGIPDDVKPRLFQPNFTTKSSGMGMGLAIVKNIVESSNGKIYYSTDLEKGTSFFVELFLYKE